jgi:hypothetical protein
MDTARELHAAGDIEGARRLAKIALERRDVEAPQPATAISEDSFANMVWLEVENTPLILSEEDFEHLYRQFPEMNARLVGKSCLKSLAITLALEVRLREFALAFEVTSKLPRIYREHMDRTARMGKI